MAERKNAYILIALLIAMIALIGYSVYICPWSLDDAYISFRYAENLVAGKGLVFNEGEKVEGYTNFLWIMILALGKAIGFDTVWYARICGLLASASCFLLLANLHRFISSIERKTTATAVILLGTSPIFISWGISGMEVSLDAFLILLVLLYYYKIKDKANTRGFTILGLLSVLMITTRPEGSIILAVITANLLISSRSGKLRSLTYILLPVIVIYLPYFAWRYSYYGYLLPNTFYDKVGTNVYQLIRGIGYFVKFIIASFFMVIPFIDIPLLAAWYRESKELRLLLYVAAAYTLYIIAVGGDFMPALRFFAPIVPVLAILSAAWISLLKSRKAAGFYLALVIAYNISQTFLNHHITDILWTDKVAFHGKEVGLWLKEHVASDVLLATNTAGSIPYYSGLATIDMLGLTDLHIAHRKMPSLGSGPPGHEKGDAEYVLSRKPDLIQFGSSYGKVLPDFFSDLELYLNPEFQNEYVLRKVLMPSGHTLLIYENRAHPVLP